MNEQLPAHLLFRDGICQSCIRPLDDHAGVMDGLLRCVPPTPTAWQRFLSHFAPPRQG